MQQQTNTREMMDDAMGGIAKTDSLTKLDDIIPPANNDENVVVLTQPPPTKVETHMLHNIDLTNSTNLLDLHVLGLKDYYKQHDQDNIKNVHFDNQEYGYAEPIIQISSLDPPDLQSRPFELPSQQQQQGGQDSNTYIKGDQLNDLIGQYLCELTAQTKLSLDSFSLQNSESLDEEQQQQVLEMELNCIRQKIYNRIVEKLNLSVIQSITSITTSSNLRESSSKDLQSSSVTFQYPMRHQKSQSQTPVDVYQLIQIKNEKMLEEQQIQIQTQLHNNPSKEQLCSLVQQALGISQQYQNFTKQLNKEIRRQQVESIQQIQVLSQMNEYEELIAENNQLREENQKLQEENSEFRSRLQLQESKTSK